jgi:DNA-binding NarL/FixJ family response regulator
MIKVLVLENHNLFRIALQFAFDSYPNIHLAGDAGNGDDLFRLLSNTPADVMLIGVMKTSKTHRILVTRILCAVFAATIRQLKFLPLPTKILTKSCNP